MGIRNTFIRFFDNERYLQVETLYNTAKEKYYRGFALFNSINSMVDLPNDFDYKEIVCENIDTIKHYDSVLKSYDEIRKNSKEGLAYYVNEKKMRMPDHMGILEEKDQFQLKETLVGSAKTIKEYTSIIKTYNQIKYKHRDGFDRFISLNISQDVDGTIGFMRLICSKERKILNYDNVIKQYNRLLSKRKGAIRLFLNRDDIEQVAYTTKEEVVSNEGKIEQINSILKEYLSIKSLYPNAVDSYLAEHTPDVKSLTFIKDHLELFQISELFYIKVSEKHKNTLCLFGLSEKDLTSVSMDSHKAKMFFLEYLSMKKASYNEPVFSMENDISVFFKYIQDSARSLLGASQIINPDGTRVANKYFKASRSFQWDKENLSDLCEITRLAHQNNYTLRQVYSLIVKKKDDILSYYNMKGKAASLTFSLIIDYFTDKDLREYLELLENEKDIRSKASYIAFQYRKGLKACCPSSVSWGENRTIEQCMEIINKEKLIMQKNTDIENEERKQREQEEREREERLRRQKESEKNRLISKLSSWYTNAYGIKHMWMYAYLPTNCGIYANDEEWDIRNLIWAFKNNPSKPARHYTYSEALNVIVKNAVLILEKDLGSDLSKITLVCVPSSNKVINERRFKAFSEQLCKETGMTNAFSKIEIIQDAIPKREGGTTDAVLRFDCSFFKNRYILIFDDIMTSGRSVEHLRQQMNQMGAMTIGALTIGKTIYEHVAEDPISFYKRRFW